ncbi:MAG: single-stranded-DNA-specific exonuclease RecJ [Betaproteobacteria bacterium]|nr:single-stranded-DNA-specific exonuclease RecJ [Betaproteobacteria bacterium]NBY34314.1 single-stranded-DNA-specific exonuclease RecJ [Betaproteobacteria bacterium]
MKLQVRDVPPRSVWALEQSGVHPVLARLFAARGVHDAQELKTELALLLPPAGLKGIDDAAQLLANAIAQQLRFCIVADYDCDGATACAVALRGLTLLGAQHVSFIVPDRVVDGYGLTPDIAQRVHASGAQVLITVDNGIASVSGVEEAKRLGLQVLITDHHLPGPELPTPDALVNPNQPGCSFESKSMAGVGVMFYVLLALRAVLRQRGIFSKENEPKLDGLLPLVALGTVADVVALDSNNRRLVAQGLLRIRKGHLPAGMAALFKVAARDATQASSQDMGFAIGPRINAAGRLSDMTLGIECLRTDDTELAWRLAQQLDTINRERRSMEGDMREQALLIAESLMDSEEIAPAALCVFDEDFHEGVVGIIAGRLKDLHYRPCFVFASSQSQGQAVLKGSGRSIPGFHLRDALDAIAKRHTNLLLRFGGHAMAAGCTLLEDDLATFEIALQDIATQWLDAATLAQTLATDGSLPQQYVRPDMVKHLQAHVWGQGFAAPVFQDTVNVLSQKIVGEKHLSLKLQLHGQLVDAIWFGRTEGLPVQATVAYRLDINTWQGMEKLQLQIEAMQPFYN